MNTIFAYSQQTTQTNRGISKKGYTNVIAYIVYIISHKKIPILVGLMSCLVGLLGLYIYFVTMTSTTGYFLAQSAKKYDSELFAYNVDKLYIIDLQSRMRDTISQRPSGSEKTISL